jgi:hypothetical protein
MGQSAYLPLSAEITRDNQSEFIDDKPNDCVDILPTYTDNNQHRTINDKCPKLLQA